MIESLFLPLIAGLSLAAGQPAPVTPPAPQAQTRSQTKLTTQNRAALRCSAAFAIVTQRDVGEAGEAGRGQQVELRNRGREFFVLTLAGLMDEHQLDRAAIEREVRVEAQKLSASGEADQIMPACLLMLQASGL